jgi:hypothetical protein
MWKETKELHIFWLYSNNMEIIGIRYEKQEKILTTLTFLITLIISSNLTLRSQIPYRSNIDRHSVMDITDKSHL